MNTKKSGIKPPAAPPTEMSLRFIVAILLAGGPAAGASQFTSGPAHVALVELFTSEGCSSCPPAETWLNGLRQSPGLWRDFVPVAWHVNYWDGLGWADRWASRAFTDRQYAYAAAWQTDHVYTPGFVRDGREWRIPAGGTLPRADGMPGVLAAAVAADRVSVTFAPSLPGDGNYSVHLVLLGGGIATRVKAGENRGETLAHEFVALALVQRAMKGGRAELVLPAASSPGVARRAIAVWVTRPNAMEPLQAVGGWLD